MLLLLPTPLHVCPVTAFFVCCSSIPDIFLAEVKWMVWQRVSPDCCCKWYPLYYSLMHIIHQYSREKLQFHKGRRDIWWSLMGSGPPFACVNTHKKSRNLDMLCKLSSLFHKMLLFNNFCLFYLKYGVFITHVLKNK